MIKTLINFEKYSMNEGIYTLTPVENNFEDLYLKVRKKENRIYSDYELRELPFSLNSNPHNKEWELRAKTFERFRDYIKFYVSKLNILDLGCGNGWFFGQLSKLYDYNFYCVDVNLTELKQAGRVFNNEKIKFCYADIFTADLPENSFDIITINSAVQYFPDITKLLERLSRLINESGEIHILDSQLYSKNEIEDAKKRTRNYYSSIGFAEMAENYFHHTWESLSAFNYEILFDPNSIVNKVKKILMMKDSPFPWIKITR